MKVSVTGTPGLHSDNTEDLSFVIEYVRSDRVIARDWCPEGTKNELNISITRFQELCKAYNGDLEILRMIVE